METRLNGHLAVILASPPLTTSGAHTLSRVTALFKQSGADSLSISNLLIRPTSSVLEMGECSSADWIASRRALDDALADATWALMAYGATIPSGSGSSLFRNQTDWLRSKVSVRGIPALTVGAAPRHPSRWQRLTSRDWPGLTVSEGALRSLQPWLAMNGSSDSSEGVAAVA